MSDTMGDSHPVLGRRILGWIDELARWSESQDGLTCTYLSDAHRAVAWRLRELMADAGLETSIDPLGNVVGHLMGTDRSARTLLIGSHYDTVRNAGKYDGRLGILTAIAVVEHLRATGQRLPYAVQIIAFADEEGARFSSGYLGSAAVAGRFDPAWFGLTDAAGTRLDDALRWGGTDPGIVPKIARNRDTLLGYVELHIEQGPVLLNEGLPVGIVTGIAGAVRLEVTIQGAAGHAGTVPMSLRHDALVAASEIVLYVERRCATVMGLVGTVGRLTVPHGTTNVIPGRCEFSVDVRAAEDGPRDAAVGDIRAEIERVAIRRKVRIEVEEKLRMPAVVCTPRLQTALAAAVSRCKIPLRRLVSGAGHDAVMFAGITDIGMLFVRCGNGGISHHPQETVTVDDAEVGARVLIDFLQNVCAPHEPV